jgi:hypothetical protein
MDEYPFFLKLVETNIRLGNYFDFQKESFEMGLFIPFQNDPFQNKIKAGTVTFYEEKNYDNKLKMELTGLFEIKTPQDFSRFDYQWYPKYWCKIIDNSNYIITIYLKKHYLYFSSY